MLEHAALTPEALAYYNALPLSDQVAISHSNLTFRTLEDLKSYQAHVLPDTDSALYQTLPEPAIPSNAALDPLDSQPPD